MNNRMKTDKRLGTQD